MNTRYLPVLLLLLPFFAAGREPDVATNTAMQQAKPLSFIENKGQIVDQHGNYRNDIDAKLEANGLVVFVGDGAIHYQWSRESGASGHPPPPPSKGGTEMNLKHPASNIQHLISNIQHPGPTEIYRMDVELVGANKNAQLVRGAQQDYFENYYLPQCPDGATAYAYNTVTYKNVYPGIDWVLYSKNNQLKYDFVVHTGGDVKQIKLRYNGATALRLVDGAMIAETPFGSITEQKPYSYDAETKQELASAFTLNGNELSFSIATANARALVIDPVLDWATFYGGIYGDYGNSIAVDTATGNVYLGGTTQSSGNIATTGAHQATMGSSQDGMLVKFNSAGVRQWGTYYGGLYNDAITSIAFDVNGFVYAAGTTSSPTGIATSGTHQTVGYMLHNGDSDGFLVKFNPAGVRQWGTYCGGDSLDDIFDVACDAMGNTFVVGYTNSDTGLTTPGSAQPLYSNLGWYQTSDRNAFIVKFSPAGARLWGTYDGHGENVYRSVTCDAYGNIYAVGGTLDSFTCTPGCFQTKFGLGGGDGTIAKYTTNGARVWATYYGGFGGDVCYTVACLGTKVFIGGMSGSFNAIASPGAFQTTIGGIGWDGFLLKFDSSGSRDWGTYVGAAGNWESVTDIAFGPVNNLYVIGGTNSTTGIVTPGAWNMTPNGSFFSEFTLNGTRRWTSYCMPSLGLIAYDLKTDRLYVAGNGGSTNVATPGSHQSTLGGGNVDAFLAKFRPDTLVKIIAPIDTTLCAGDSLKVIYKCVHGFDPTNTFTALLSDANGSFANPVAIGSITSGASDTIDCMIPLNIPSGNGYRVRIVASVPTDTSDMSEDNIRIINVANTIASANTPVCAGSTLNLAVTNTAGAIYAWTGPGSYSSSQQNPTISGMTSGKAGNYVVTASLNWCTFKDTVDVVVKTTPAIPTLSTNSPICAGGSLNLAANSLPAGVTYSWTGPNGFTSTAQNPVINPVSAMDAGVYSVQAELNGCTSAAATTNVVINTVSTLAIYANPNDTVCTGANVTFVSMPFNAGASPQYQWYKNGAIVPGATTGTYSTTTLTTGDSIYCIMTVTGVCADPLSIISGKIGVTVLPLAPGPNVSISADPGLLLSPWQLVKFTAVATSAGPLPKYQWKRNGQDVLGANGDNWSANNLSNSDTISCVVTSSVVCATPASVISNKMVVNIKTGIEDVQTNGDLKLYPNPNNGSFVVYLPFASSLRVDVVDALGRIVYSDVQPAVNNHQLEITLPPSVANGVYMLKLQGDGGIETIRFTVSR